MSASATQGGHKKTRFGRLLWPYSLETERVYSQRKR